MFGNIAVSGFQMIAKAGFTERNITIVALSLTMGIGFTQVPAIFKYAPALVQQIFANNAIAIAFIVALILAWVLPRDSKANKTGTAATSQKTETTGAAKAAEMPRAAAAADSPSV